MEAHMKINGELIRALWKEKSWSQEHLANASGVSARTIQRVESDGVASAETRLALAAALDVPVAALMAGSSASLGGARRVWRVPLWGWLGWGIVTFCSVGVIAAGSAVEGLPLQQLALNLFPWFALSGVCLVAVAIIGVWQRSRLRAVRET